MGFFLGNNEDQEVGNDLQDKFKFICQESETGLFQTQLENGIMGLRDSSMHLPNVLSNTNKIPANQFSLCLTVEKYISKGGYHAGFMTLGGIDSSHHISPMRYAQVNGYDVNIRALYLQKPGSNDQTQERNLSDIRKVSIPAEYTSTLSHTVDSGTTITYFSSKFADGFKKEWQLLTGFPFIDDSETSIHLTNEQFSKLPTVLIQIEALNDGCDESNTIEESRSESAIVRKLDGTHCNDIMLSFPPSHYLLKDLDDTYYINISFEDLGITNGILGANIIQGHDVLFDVENSRMGFAPSSCKYE